jgi:acetyl-CoA carboxylase biotin carboxyl carrier protein
MCLNGWTVASGWIFMRKEGTAGFWLLSKRYQTEHTETGPKEAEPMVAIADPEEAEPVLSAADLEKLAKESGNLVFIKSPIVGTFYGGPSPDSKPFVRIGQRVQTGRAVCIVESMKLMNEIEADCDGIILKRMLADGDPVEFGEPLFAMIPT